MAKTISSVLFFCLIIISEPVSANIGETCEQTIGTFDSQGRLISGPEPEECSGGASAGAIIGGVLVVGLAVYFIMSRDKDSSETKTENLKLIQRDWTEGKGIRVNSRSHSFGLYAYPASVMESQNDSFTKNSSTLQSVNLPSSMNFLRLEKEF